MIPIPLYSTHKAETVYHTLGIDAIQALSPYVRSIKGGRLVLAARMHKHQSPLLFSLFHYRSWADPISVLELSQIKESTHLGWWRSLSLIPVDSAWSLTIQLADHARPRNKSSLVLVTRKVGERCHGLGRAQWSGKPASGFRNPLHVYRYSTSIIRPSAPLHLPTDTEGGYSMNGRTHF